MATSKKNRNLVIGLVLLVILLAAAAVWKSKSSAKGEEVEVEKAENRTIKETVAASGRIFPVTEVKISSDVSGEVVELYVKEGDSVRINQLLARIDPDAYQSQVERGVAGVNSAKAQAANSRAQIENLRAQKEQIIAQLENARTIFKRNEQLKKEGVVSAADFESAETSLRSLEANLRSVEASIRASEQSAKAADFAVQSAEATLKELRTSLRRTDIYAPMSGIVSLLNVEKGERVVGTIQMTGTELMRIADLREMEVQVDVSENDIPRVTMGDEVDIEVDAYLNRKFKGKVTEIANSASNMSSSTGLTSLTTDQVTNFIVTISVDPASYADLVTASKPYPFRPGMSASVEISTQTIKDALSVPIQAVTTREFDKNNKAKSKKDTPESAAQTEEEEDLNVEVKNQGKAANEKTEDNIREVVFVLTGETVAAKEVKTGIQDDTYIQILSGLNVGEQVVTGPYSAVSRKLNDGDKVTLKKEKKKEKE